jgi:Holliday junction resolvasome RuvABC endonuclease subunit
MGIDPSSKHIGWSIIENAGLKADMKLIMFGQYDINGGEDVAGRADVRYKKYREMAMSILRIAKEHEVGQFVMETMYFKVVGKAIIETIEARAVLASTIM